MDIVVNEWLLEYLRPDADADHMDLALKFVSAWAEKHDRVVIRRTSPFVQKFYGYMKQFGWDAAFKRRFSGLNRLLFVNSDKTLILDDCDVKELPEVLADGIPADDKYLIELWSSVPGSVVVTTDGRLKDILLKYDASAEIYLLTEFLRTYCS